jgi:hypothetical protein
VKLSPWRDRASPPTRTRWRAPDEQRAVRSWAGCRSRLALLVSRITAEVGAILRSVSEQQQDTGRSDARRPMPFNGGLHWTLWLDWRDSARGAKRGARGRRLAHDPFRGRGLESYNYGGASRSQCEPLRETPRRADVAQRIGVVGCARSISRSVEAACSRCMGSSGRLVRRRSPGYAGTAGTLVPRMASLADGSFGGASWPAQMHSRRST